METSVEVIMLSSGKQGCKRLRDSILLSVFSSHIFARYKNAALWI